MKRFITYLYECKRGNKSQNVGFIRVNVRGEETTMEVYIRNLIRSADEGRIYAIVSKEKIVGIEIGKVRVVNGQSDIRIILQTDDIMESNFSINDIEGIGIHLDGGIYIASCWKDTYADELVRGEFEVPKIIGREEGESEIETSIVAMQEKVVSDLKVELCEESSVTYEKIDLSQIRALPSANWYLATNSFLVHGFWNYGYLVLKKEMEKSQKKLSLGVPGIFEKPEAVMAVLFGFPDFEEISEEVVGVQREKNQNAKDGTFGCWFVNLKI